MMAHANRLVFPLVAMLLLFGNAEASHHIQKEYKEYDDPARETLYTYVHDDRCSVVLAVSDIDKKYRNTGMGIRRNNCTLDHISETGIIAFLLAMAKNDGHLETVRTLHWGWMYNSAPEFHKRLVHGALNSPRWMEIAANRNHPQIYDIANDIINNLPVFEELVAMLEAMGIQLTVSVEKVMVHKAKTVESVDVPDSMGDINVPHGPTLWFKLEPIQIENSSGRE